MSDMIKKVWLLFAGAGTSITVSASKITGNIHLFFNTADMLQNHPFLYYFLIGLAGAAGGLVIKIVWGCIKRMFPKLKNIDK